MRSRLGVGVITEGVQNPSKTPYPALSNLVTPSGVRVDGNLRRPLNVFGEQGADPVVKDPHPVPVDIKLQTGPPR